MLRFIYLMRMHVFSSVILTAFLFNGGYFMYSQAIVEMTSNVMDRDQRIRKIMSDYNSGDPELRERSIACMIKELDGFIRDRVSRSSFKNDFDDLVSECKCEVISAMKNYNSDRGTPTTYFCFMITHAISHYNDSNVNKSTQHYSHIANRVKTSVRALAAKGINDPTPAMIAVHAEMSVKQAEDGLAIIRGSREKSISETEGTKEVLAMRTKSTEEEFFLNDEKQMWARAMSGMDEQSVSAFMLYHGIESDSPMTYSEVSKALGVSQKDVKKMVERTRRYLARNREIKEYYHISA